MQNLRMGFDPRAVSNMLLDFADSADVNITNLSLNKILFFCHSDSITEQGKPLINLTFEAWKYGPVLPLIYHQFKKHGRHFITSRATKLCRETGDNVTVSYSDLVEHEKFLNSCFIRYTTLAPSALVSLSHSPGGAWDTVWNSSDTETYDMKISDELIYKEATHFKNNSKRKNMYVH